MALRPATPAAPRTVRQPTAAVVHRGNLEISTQAQLKKFEKVTEIKGNLTINVPGKVVLPNLTRVHGQLDVGAESEIALNTLKTVTEGFTVAGSMTLSRISLPTLSSFPA